MNEIVLEDREGSSIAVSVKNYDKDSYLLASDELISSANLSACGCVNLDLEIACLNLTILETLSFNKLLTNIDTSIFGIALNSDFNSSGILILNSSINGDSDSDYLKLSDEIASST